MAEPNDNTAPPGNPGSRGPAGGAGRGGGRPASPLQVDEAANRIVIDFAAARRGGGGGGRDSDRGGDRLGARRSAGPTAGTDAGELMATPDGDLTAGGQRLRRGANGAARRRGPAQRSQPALPGEVGAPLASPSEPAAEAIAGIPTIPLEPEPQEFGRDLDAEVYIPSEHGTRRKRRQRARKPRRAPNTFAMIEKGERPKGHAPIPKWQKVVMAVCAVAIAGILIFVLGTGKTKLPGWDQGVLVRTQIEFLDQNLNLPYVPQAVTWQLMTDEKQDVAGPARNRLIAVMLFTPEQAAALIAQATPMPQPEDHQAIDSERWFPDDARDLMSDVDSDTTVYDASIFYDGVFQRGIMLRLGDTGYIVAKLFDY